MTTTATTIACPDWCTTRHDIDPDGGHDGPGWPDIPNVSDTQHVSIGCGLNDEHGVTVYIEADCTLTPDQARQAGLTLLSAASWAKDHQVSA